MRDSLPSSDSIEKVRTVEANAAANYFAAWKSVQIRFRDRDLAKIPARWLRTDSRASVLTGAPRAATSPLNALRNYLFACLESEARLALLAHGLDPTLGVLHADQRNRDSLALDAMEPVRGDVDAFLLDLLEDRVFSARDFGELPNGVCRIAAPLTHELALTLPHWRQCLRPIAAGLAQTFRDALTSKGAAPRTSSIVKRSGRRAIVAEPSPLATTPRKASQPRPYATRSWRTPTVEGRPANPTACALCGEPVEKRRRRTNRRGQRSAALRGGQSRARRGDQRGASPQSPLGARASGPARRGVVQARDCVQARCVLAYRDRQGDGAVARSLLAHPGWSARPAPAALGSLARADRGPGRNADLNLRGTLAARRNVMASTG